MNKNICNKCENKLTDEELEREVEECVDCQYRKELNVPNNQQTLW